MSDSCNQSQVKCFQDKDLCKIKNIRIEELPKNSLYVRPYRLLFTDEHNNNQVERIWDCVDAHSSVAIIVFNKSNDTLVLVRQFRPAVNVMFAKEHQQVSSLHDIDFSKQDPAEGITWELCAGIIDKSGKTNKEIIQIELLEECGYNVDLDTIEKVSQYRTGVGIHGGLQELFYVEVTNEMKTNMGGGNATEQELIVVHEISVNDVYKFIFDETKAKSTNLMFAMFWFLHQKKRLPPV
ncbi:unnamed protein product [Didymodactylos carnosus]|uniref:Uridine diphosphate glucose pyrophosphatase NUDT14 n=1 Tax=Didymodactylos carnosus TaxID=1234261 RepID=A0A814HCX3_9BILA|nr:unnamed protein product [Didymodactylos carnosus]CAF1139801.1 unnamed protein product [Didymodactylos carnosus]CAF3778853.1 unnamed protein product [Didymodactylos carnosus]CAF3933412.1 unnamed protein product [Didymodactylos carnosus]